MSNFAQELQAELLKKSILNHPYYQSWNMGALTRESLVEYSKQYFHHVQSFPQSLSALHSKCEPTDKEARSIIMENLLEEEVGEKNHPDMWLRYAEGLGASEADVKSVVQNKETQNLIDTFKTLTAENYEKGLGALFAHEFQYHEIAKTKKDGLQKFYGVTTEEALEFFTVHGEVDVWHAEQLAKLLNKLPVSAHKEVKEGAHRAIDALWGFLDGMMPTAGHC